MTTAHPPGAVWPYFTPDSSSVLANIPANAEAGKYIIWYPCLPPYRNDLALIQCILRLAINTNEKSSMHSVHTYIRATRVSCCFSVTQQRTCDVSDKIENAEEIFFSMLVHVSHLQI